MEIGEEHDILMEKLNALQQSLMKRVQNKGKDLKPSQYYRNTLNEQNKQ